MQFIDLRSDTVTQPTQAMRDAMCRAVVGDDVFEDDPTAKELEAYAAQRLGKEAALFVTSGMQGNTCALLAHTRRGDCVVIAPTAHIAAHEAGSYGQLAGVSLRFPESVNGVMDPASVRACLTDDSDVQVAPAGLVVMENAHSTGSVLPLDNMRAVFEIAHTQGVPVHLDGARLFNAAAALGIADVRELTQYCDTVMCCLSKGLCAPVGSILAGPKDVIWRARRARRILGGGLRQVGFLAAAGMVALRDMTGRLSEDHENAKYLGELLSAVDGVHVFAERTQIDMVFFTTDWDAEKASRYPAWMLGRGIKVTGCMDGEYRMVCHHDITRAACQTAAEAIRAFAAEG
ncbi:L-allo-threonine aldolase [uncultured Butyricicoccus sp.]|uniref:Threonine aldolase family protein n=1 Tax=Agathobaculum ammoniilyticum TaxID=2981778 RepID=A0ABT2U0V2_9FIRM|nr:threonine aldolase family protein [Agathobaculum ammoniilyticum]MCU6788251.1 threonine aldolase family protein [Agathobaculum ammoniilyticum]SCI64531.1 L-allo-threonine aldolase [uncultured Butyricicoccus sp.]